MTGVTPNISWSYCSKVSSRDCSGKRQRAAKCCGNYVTGSDSSRIAEQGVARVRSARTYTWAYRCLNFDWATDLSCQGECESILMA